MDPRFFPTPDELRAWLDDHHDSAEELWVGLYKKATGRPSITWPELVDELICYGWIDGLRKSLDDESYMIRVTPRRPDSVWSKRNLERMEALREQDRVEPPGVAVFRDRNEEKSGTYSYEREHATLGDEFEALFRADESAWAWWLEQAPGYRKLATWWVVGAKRETTRRRRLRTLIEDSAAGRKIKPLRR